MFCIKTDGREEVGDVRENGSDLEKAYDKVPREMVMAAVRWMGVPEAEARMVEVMHERTKGRVLVGSGSSEEFPFNIGLRQGSALSPLLFIILMELIRAKISTNVGEKPGRPLGKDGCRQTSKESRG